MNKLYCWVFGLTVYTLASFAAGPLVAFFVFWGVIVLLGDYYDA